MRYLKKLKVADLLVIVILLVAVVAAIVSGFVFYQRRD